MAKFRFSLAQIEASGTKIGGPGAKVEGSGVKIGALRSRSGSPGQILGSGAK